MRPRTEATCAASRARLRGTPRTARWGPSITGASSAACAAKGVPANVSVNARKAPGQTEEYNTVIRLARSGLVRRCPGGLDYENLTRFCRPDGRKDSRRAPLPQHRPPPILVFSPLHGALSLP